MPGKETKQTDGGLMLTVFGKTVLAAALAVMCYLGLGIFTGIGQQVSGYRCYAEPVTASTAEKFFDTGFGRFDDYDTEGKFLGSYVYNYEHHAFKYSAEASERVRETQPTIDVENLGHNTQIVYEKNAAWEITVEAIAQIVLLLLLLALVYDPMWHRGDKDRNLVQFGRMQEDKWRGLRVGLLSAIPSAVTVALLFVSKLTGILPRYIVYYRLLMMPFAPLNNWMTDGMKWTSQVPLGFLAVSVLCWAVVPLTAAIAYRLGYNGVSLAERIVYKKK